MKFVLKTTILSIILFSTQVQAKTGFKQTLRNKRSVMYEINIKKNKYYLSKIQDNKKKKVVKPISENQYLSIKNSLSFIFWSEFSKKRKISGKKCDNPLVVFLNEKNISTCDIILINRHSALFREVSKVFGYK